MIMNKKIHYVVCIDNIDSPASLELHKVYRVLPDEVAAADGDLRVIDESGEDYLHPLDYFMPLPASKRIESTLRNSFARMGTAVT